MPFIDEITGRVQLAVAPSSQAFWKILRSVDTEGIIDHQNDEYLVLQGHVSVIFLNGWQSISVLAKKFQAIIDKVSKYDNDVLSSVHRVNFNFANSQSPHLFIFYNNNTVADLNLFCIAKDIQKNITNTHNVGGAFDIRSCSKDF
ncbi:MAG: hypothetical protein GY761_16605 [Hyphomicrobiales bacterium]|nr:hypothetical protein [Hyphomicrobiales bacterium]